MLDSLSIQIINKFQGGFPISSSPFADAAKSFNVDSTTLIDKVKSLLDSGYLTRFGPLFDADKLGGAFTLAAIEAPEDDFEHVSKIVNGFTEVAHNYRRSHRLNMWFVVASDKVENIHKTLKSIEQASGLEVYNFPKIKEFYIGLWLDIDSDGKISTKSIRTQNNNKSYTVDATDKDIVKDSQAGLALVENPYQDLAKKLGLTTDDVLSRFSNMLECGIIRRIGLVPNHYKLGLRGNGMSVWSVSDELVEELGEQIGSLDFVSHAYKRPRHLPLWPYNMFAMVHGQNKDEVKTKVEEIAKILGSKCKQHDILFSSEILKKTGMRLV